MLRASAKKRGYSCRPKSLNTIEDSIRPLREFDCLVDWEQKEFPEPETLVKRLREDLEKQEVAFHLR